MCNTLHFEFPKYFSLSRKHLVSCNENYEQQVLYILLLLCHWSK